MLFCCTVLAFSPVAQLKKAQTRGFVINGGQTFRSPLIFEAPEIGGSHSRRGKESPPLERQQVELWYFDKKKISWVYISKICFNTFLLNLIIRNIKYLSIVRWHHHLSRVSPWNRRTGSHQQSPHVPDGLAYSQSTQHCLKMLWQYNYRGPLSDCMLS